MTEFKDYMRKQIAQLRPYKEGERLSDGVSISQADKEAGSPKVGDMIARNPKNHADQWLIAEQYFRDNFEYISEIKSEPDVIHHKTVTHFSLWDRVKIMLGKHLTVTSLIYTKEACHVIESSAQQFIPKLFNGKYPLKNAGMQFSNHIIKTK